MHLSHLHTITDTAVHLGISEALIIKFIKKGLVTPVKDATAPKLTGYGIRRLSRILDLYERSHSLDNIEQMLNH